MIYLFLIIDIIVNKVAFFTSNLFLYYLIKKNRFIYYLLIGLTFDLITSGIINTIILISLFFLNKLLKNLNFYLVFIINFLICNIVLYFYYYQAINLKLLLFSLLLNLIMVNISVNFNNLYIKLNGWKYGRKYWKYKK